ncbi:ABC transporter ATP-binding protein [Streptomyces griseus]|uniref:ABC transporter ATP-binding protein n=1 Tax=Streptomyces griseus TaxID=1911 RepID=UPI0033A58BEA
MSDLVPALPTGSTPHGATEPPLITVTDLDIRLPDGPVLLPKTSARIHAGHVTALMGASGSGKTTLLRALVGHLPAGAAATGAVDVLGRTPHLLPTDELRILRRHSVAYVGQDPGSALNPRMTVRSLVAELATDPSPEKALALLAECSLPAHTGIADRRPTALSGGQQRRVALARALARTPHVVLLDEPTAGLDTAVRDEIAQLLSHIAASRNIAFVIATHDPRLVESCADRIIRLTSAVPPASQPSTGQNDNADEPHGRPDGDGLAARAIDAHFRVGHRQRPVLTRVSFTAAPGSATGIIGPSGSGKTTLLRVLAGLHTTHTGQLALDGRPLSARVQRRTREQQRRIQLVPQNPLAALNPRHSVAQQLTRPLRLHADVPRSVHAGRVTELLARVDLPAGYAERYPAELSGGQRQRVSIARALAADPGFLLCDEITSALDADTATGIMDLLSRLCTERGMTLVVVSHEHHLIARYTDSVHMLDAGRVIESGPTGRILSG